MPVPSWAEGITDPNEYEQAERVHNAQQNYNNVTNADFLDLQQAHDDAYGQGSVLTHMGQDPRNIYNRGMSLKRYHGEIVPQMNNDPYWKDFNSLSKASSKIGKGMFGGVEKQGMFDLGARTAAIGQFAPDALTRGGRNMADRFRQSVGPDQMGKLAAGAAKAKNTKQNLQIASVLASLASAGLGSWMTAAGTPMLTQAGAMAAMGAANAGARGAISGEMNPADVAVGAGVGAIGPLGNVATGAGMNPIVTGALSGAAAPALSGAASGNFDPMAIGTGALMGGIGPAMKASGLPSWATPIAKAGLDYGLGAAGVKKGKKGTAALPSTMMSMFPSFASPNYQG